MSIARDIVLRRRRQKDYRSDYADYDMRRGVRGSGRGRRDRRDYADDFDYADYDMRRGYDRRGYDRIEFEGEYIPDGHLRLTFDECMEWKRNMVNADGSKGPHFKLKQVIDAAEKMDCDFRDFSEETLCMAANFLYSLFGEDLKRFIMPEKEAMHYVELAKSFLERPFSRTDYDPRGDERLAILYNCLVCDE